MRSLSRSASGQRAQLNCRVRDDVICDLSEVVCVKRADIGFRASLQSILHAFAARRNQSDRIRSLSHLNRATDRSAFSITFNLVTVLRVIGERCSPQRLSVNECRGRR